MKSNQNWDEDDDTSPTYFYEVIKISGSTVNTLKSGNGYAHTLSAINNCLYYQASTKINELNLITLEETPILQNVSTASLYSNIACYIDLSGNVYETMLSNITSKKLLYPGNSNTMGFPMNIHFYKDAVYFNYDWLPRIDKINAKGQWSEIIKTKKNHINFGIIGGYFVYTDSDDNDFIAPFGSNITQHKDLAAWIFNQDEGAISSASADTANSLPSVVEKIGNVQSAKDIYANCSSSVFYIETYDENAVLLGTGSGFFITNDGLALTNYHVIEGASFVKVVLSDGKVLLVDSSLYSSDEDIAILLIPGSGFNFLKIGDSEKVVGGQLIYSIGSPLGLENTISVGLISNPSRKVDGHTWFQISAPISPGSSGGALINEYGEVIGITTGSFVNGQNINLAIPIKQIYELLE